MTEDIKEPSEEITEEVLNEAPQETQKVEIDNTIPEVKKENNWLIIGGIVVVIVLVVAGLKYAGVI